MARKQDSTATGEAPAPTPAEAPGHEPEASAAAGEGVSVVVNPRLDAAEYVDENGRRWSRDEATEVTQAEYEELSGVRVDGVQVFVKGGK